MISARSSRLVGSITVGSALLGSPVAVREEQSFSLPTAQPAVGELAVTVSRGSAPAASFVATAPETPVAAVRRPDPAPPPPARTAQPLIARPDSGTAFEAELIVPPGERAETAAEPEAPQLASLPDAAAQAAPFADAELLEASSPFLEAFAEVAPAEEPAPAESYLPGPASLAQADGAEALLTVAEPASLPLAEIRAPLEPAAGAAAETVPDANLAVAAPAAAPALAPFPAPVALPAAPREEARPAPAAPAPAAPASSASLAPVIAPATASEARPAPAPQSLSPAPGRPVFPAEAGETTITYDDELILQIRVRGITATDTIIAYGTREGVFLPLGELARILDLAIRVSDDGNYASGWFLSEDRTLTIDLRQGELIGPNGSVAIDGRIAQAFDGEMYLRAETFAAIFPLEIVPDLRAQAVLITTLEPFPFEERMRRDAERARLAGRAGDEVRETWPRQETPFLPLSFPMGDVELRTMTDVTRGERGEIDLRLSGDLAWMTAQTFFSATTRDGLVAALVELGRRDTDGDLLGPLRATEFLLGDVATTAMPLGLRGSSGRGGYLTNRAISSESVFDRIDLRGVLPDGYEVELYRNDVLLGSTRTPVNGQYEFLQVPLDYGINVVRLVFYGPQGQRREDVRRINVGDGRLSPGRLEYAFGAVQRGVNLLGVEGPDFRPADRYGDWQASGEIAYGLSQRITAVASGALFQDDGQDKWLATAGLRSGIGAMALRADAGISSEGGSAFSLGLGGRVLGGSFTASHFEYRGNFIDELRNTGSEVLRRATELDFNTSVPLGGTALPLSLRGRNVVFADGRSQLSAGLRGSMRVQGVIASNTLDYLRSQVPLGPKLSQLIGNFDLATFNRSHTQLRASVGYRLHPDTAITVIGAEVDHTIADGLSARGSAAYSLADNNLTLGASAIRTFDAFTLALDGQYALRDDSYSLALRLGFSFGRDPARGRMFVDGPGMASSGAAAVRAFHDLDGDSVFSPGDLPLADVDFAVFNLTDTTDAEGYARLGGLGNGNRVSVQIDPSTLPDILMAPVTRGIEIVPRAGRFHVADFPIINLGEIEGTVSFTDDASARGVSGLRLGFRRDGDEAPEWVRTERGGYYFFERAKPGRYTLILDPEQAERLGICLDGESELVLDPSGGIVSRDVAVRRC